MKWSSAIGRKKRRGNLINACTEAKVERWIEGERKRSEMEGREGGGQEEARVERREKRGRKRGRESETE